MSLENGFDAFRYLVETSNTPRLLQRRLELGAERIKQQKERQRMELKSKESIALIRQLAEVKGILRGCEYLNDIGDLQSALDMSLNKAQNILEEVINKLIEKDNQCI